MRPIENGASRGRTAATAVATNAHAGSAIRKQLALGGGLGRFLQILLHSSSSPASFAWTNPAAGRTPVLPALRQTTRRLENGTQASSAQTRRFFIARNGPTCQRTIPADAASVNPRQGNGLTYSCGRSRSSAARWNPVFAAGTPA